MDWLKAKRVLALMIWALAAAMSSVLGEISLVPGSELWAGIPIPDDSEALMFISNDKETLFARDREGTYLSNNRVLTNVLEQISIKEKSYEQIQRFVLWTMDNFKNSQYVPPPVECLSSFPGPSQLFSFMMSHPIFVQRNSKVDINWIFILFVTRAAQSRGLMNPVESIPFSEIASNFLSDLATFLAGTTRAERLRRDARSVLESMSKSCERLRENLSIMYAKREPLASFHEYLGSNVHSVSLSANVSSLRGIFVLFCGMIHSDFNVALGEEERARLIYTISRNYRIIRTMAGCVIYAKTEDNGVAMAKEFGQMLSRLGVDLLMYSLEYDTDYRYIESIASDGGYFAREGIWEVLKDKFRNAPAAVPWKDVALTEIPAPEKRSLEEVAAPEVPATSSDHRNKLDLLFALSNLAHIFISSTPETLSSLEEVENMTEAGSSLCADILYFHRLKSIFKDSEWDTLFSKPDKFWEPAWCPDLKAKKKELLEMKGKMLCMGAMAIAFIVIFNAYIIFLVCRRLRAMGESRAEDGRTST